MQRDLEATKEDKINEEAGNMKFESEEEVSAAIAMVIAMDMTGFTMD